jgi:hypothetical protein
MQIGLIKESLQVQRSLNPQQDLIHHGYLAHQFITSEHNLDVFGVRRVEERFR